MSDAMKSRFKRAGKSGTALRIDPAILESIIRQIVRTDDKEKIQVTIY